MRRQWAPHSPPKSHKPLTRIDTHSLPLPHGLPHHRHRHNTNKASRLCPCTRSKRPLAKRAFSLLALITLLWALYVLSSGIPPTFNQTRRFERDLPQHNLTLAREMGTSYLRVRGQVSGRGWNNVLQETILLSYLAQRTHRAYVFEDYTWSHLPLPYVLHNNALRPSRLPLNAFISGPTAGGPLPGAPHLRAVSEAFWEEVCPRGRRRVLGTEGQPRGGEVGGREVLEWWVRKVGDLGLGERCVEIDSSEGEIFDFMLFGDPRILDIWPELSTSPVLQDFSWSPLVHSALKTNAALFSPSTPSSPNDDLPTPTPASSTTSIHPGLVAIHLRRGDFAGHCTYLARYNAQYMGFNQFPSFPDTFSPLPPSSSSSLSASQAHYLPHCLPTIPQILAKLRAVRLAHPGLRKVYVLTNGGRGWVRELEGVLRGDGWEDVWSGLDLRLGREEGYVSVAVDMAVAERAEVFIGNGFSSLTSNIAMLRIAKGLDPLTTRFW